MTRAKKANIVFYATITGENFAIDNILCRAYLPLKLTDPIELHFQPDEEQFKTLRHSKFWKYSVRGEVRGYENILEKVISANEVFSSRLTGKAHSSDLGETLMIGEPIDLRVIHILHSHSETNKAEGQFWLTPNQMLEPAYMVTNSYTGNREIEVVRQFEFMLDDQTKFNFERHYRYYENEDGDDVSFSELVAMFEIENANNDSQLIPDMLSKLDDVLLLASFAAMRRCVCLGWESYDAKTLVKQFLRNRVIPDITNSKRLRTENEIIDLAHFEDFIKTAYSNFLGYTEVAALRRAINFIIPSGKETVDGDFMVIYSALEMLVLHYRRKQSLELILPKNRFEKHVRKSLKEHIEQLNLPDLDAARRQMIKDKLSELNRISFATAFSDFCNHYSINIDDLWPITKDGEGISLSQLRNKLVHGEHFDDRHYEALIYAKEHLQWIIQRMILGILGWSADRSNVSPKKLEAMYAYQRWRGDQKVLS